MAKRSVTLSLLLATAAALVLAGCMGWGNPQDVLDPTDELTVNGEAVTFDLREDDDEDYRLDGAADNGTVQVTADVNNTDDEDALLVFTIVDEETGNVLAHQAVLVEANGTGTVTLSWTLDGRDDVHVIVHGLEGSAAVTLRATGDAAPSEETTEDESDNTTATNTTGTTPGGAPTAGNGSANGTNNSTGA
ncbi:MAG TPA: hypothetical protein VNZ52_14815 [Candidatus Thermoplasmatota archaeon]|nr:hypothetical protein [Candidatus Thermoplasmatota archaeon]